MAINASVIKEKFEDFAEDRTANKNFVVVKGKTPVKPGTETPTEWRKIENRYYFSQVMMIPAEAYGIILDKTGLCCLDFDKCLNEQGRITNEKIEKIIHELNTWVEISSSGNGLHAWVITDANTKNAKYHDKGIEIITDGHVKITGNSYPPTAGNCIELIDADKVFSILGLNKPEFSGTTGSIRGKFSDGPITSGARNSTLFSIAASMRNKGLSADSIHKAISNENQTRCVPPLADDEVRRIATSAGSYAVGNVEQIKQTNGNNPVVVDVNTEKFTLTEHTETCIDAIIQNFNNPAKRIFVRNGNLCAVKYDEKGIVKVSDLNVDNIKYILDLCCNFVTMRKKKDDDEYRLVKARPLADVPKNILGHIELHKKFPALLAIAESPYITSSGEVVTEPGYSDKTKIYFAPDTDYKQLTIPESPTKEQVDESVKNLDELICDFKFEGETAELSSMDNAGRHNAIAAILTSVLRPAIDGNTPLYLVDKPQMGTGGTLLCEIINRIATGKALTPSNAPRFNDKEEWEKVILSILQDGITNVCFDNIEGVLKSASLSSVLTSRRKVGRVLGTTNQTTFDVCVNWMGNGINLDIKGDLPRRIYMSRIITDYARPQQRTGFKIPDIKKHVLDHRYEYIRDILTIAKAYHNAGCPKPEWIDASGKKKEIPVMGSFETWRDYIGGMMVWIGKTKFLDNTEDLLTACELQTSDDEVLLEAIYQNDKLSGEFSTGKLLKIAYEHQESDLFKALPSYILSEASENNKAKKLGNHFGKIRERIFPSGFSINQTRIKQHVVQWTVNYIKQKKPEEQTALPGASP